MLLVAAIVVLVASVSAQAQHQKRHYPPGWTWKQEKAKRYENGSKRPYWMPQIWFAIAACEQPYGRNGVQWDASSSGYVTGFGFARSTWRGYKLPGYPDDATKASTWQMYQVALAVYRDYRWTGWGCYTGGGYRYHLPN